jgi:thioesterase domain-containing protein
VEAIADYYLEQVHQSQPRGPYLLGGYSFGGLVAYEMARRLRLSGAEVALLVIFDACNPALSRPTFQVDFQNGLRNPVTLVNPNRVFRFLARRARGKALAPVLRWNEALHRRLNWRFLGWRMLGRGRASVGPVIAHVETVHELAALAYRPLPYAGRVVLFRSTAQAAADALEADGGWGQLAQGGIDVHTVSGTHGELFSAENLPFIAECLGTCIQRALLGR